MNLVVAESSMINWTRMDGFELIEKVRQLSAAAGDKSRPTPLGQSGTARPWLRDLPRHPGGSNARRPDSKAIAR